MRQNGVHVARSVAEVRELHSLWHSLTSDRITADLDYFLTVVEASERALRPHVVVVQVREGAEALVLGRLERRELRTRVGYIRVAGSTVRSITVPHGGGLGIDTLGCAELALAELRDAVAAREADVVVFQRLPVGSALHMVATEQPPFLCRQHVGKRHLHWELVLPDSYGEFLASLSRSTRNHVKRYGNLVRRELGARLSIRVYSEPHEIDEIFRVTGAVAAKTYQRGLGVAFGDRPGDRARTELSLERGWFRAWVLAIGGTPIAFWHGDAYGGRFRIQVPGYDPEFARYRIGTYLLTHVVEELCADPTVEILDFGFGDAEYKRHFGNRSYEEEDVVVYGRSVKGALLNAGQSALASWERLAEGMLGSLGSREAVKRWWRSRLRSQEGANAGPQPGGR